MHTNTCAHAPIVITLTPQPPCCPPALAQTVFRPSIPPAAAYPAANSAELPAVLSIDASVFYSTIRDSLAKLATQAQIFCERDRYIARQMIM